MKKIYEYIIGSFFCNGLNGEYTKCTDTDCNSIEFLLLDENLKIRQSKSSYIGKLPKRTIGTPAVAHLLFDMLAQRMSNCK
ncbi:hypothetical protein SanaruYs_31710 [Chryseotalea sanaruensis]|uniref:Uncharacterized protein n=1 Tax=Chryseotalea sanaruensis TaxID=2482724 RepID=A0A401UDC7_9BACT|nr:hypothetical protein SanaruYs_31710 [Chryseotalea sanaruensis]